MCKCVACVLCPSGPTRLHRFLPPAHLDRDVSRWNNEIADKDISRAVTYWLDLVVERNVGECYFHNVGCKPSPRAALVMVFVNIYTFLGIKMAARGGGGGGGGKKKKRGGGKGVRTVSRKKKRIEKIRARHVGRDQISRSLP